jgi:3-methyladenine DNA glycosylase AlkD
MTFNQLLEYIKTHGDGRALESLKRLGLSTSAEYYGWAISKMDKFAAQVKKEFKPEKDISDLHTLALKLWETNIIDCQLLATYVDEPKKITEAQIDRWMADLAALDNDIGVGRKLIVNLVSKLPFAPDKVLQWEGHKNQQYEQQAWNLLARLAQTNKKLPDSYFEQFLPIIATKLQKSSNSVKDSMNWAWIAIGMHGPNLKQKALALVPKIGKVTVDYGDTSCETPDIERILKMREKWE